MEQVIGTSTKEPEKSEYLYGNEKMNEEQNKNIEPTEITKDIRRVTTNTPALSNDTPPLF